MTVPEAVEQTLWDEPPFTAVFGRWAVGDTELGGQQIKAGDALLVGIAAANTDPAVRPDLAANMEGNRAHLAFSGGPHECPGQDIGRAIADVGVDALLMRLPDLELAVDESELSWVGNIMSRHLVDLPVTFAPSPQQEIDADPLTSIAARQRARTDWEVSSPAVPRGTGATPAGPQPAHAPAGVRIASPAPPEAPDASPGLPAQRGGPTTIWQSVARWWSGR